jgi:CRISPR/Cas system-associated endonuclease Cas1
MSVSVTATNVLHKIASTLVAQQKYANNDEALLSLALSAVRSKIAYYRQRIRKLERKYKTDFDSFTDQLKGRATPAQEDDWLNWRSAQNMLDDWQQTYQDLLDGRSH